VRADSAAEVNWATFGLPGHSERFVRLVRADRKAIVASFAQLFDETYAVDHVIRAAAVSAVSDILADVELSVRAGEVRSRADLGAWALAWAKRTNFTELAEGVNATLMFVDVASSFFAAHLAADPGLLPSFQIAMQAVNVSVGRFVELIAGACAAGSSTRVQFDERRRLARELHDRVGEALSVGLRRLELHELDDPSAASGQDNVARDVLVTAMSRLRTVTSDLREASLTSIEQGLNEYLGFFRAKADVELRISGDERRASPVMLEETFLIIREAVRNALTHGIPSEVKVVVEITKRELRARVMDDGCGFEMGSVISNGVGITSMRERAALMGGQFWISSQPGGGTCVEVSLPLPVNELSADTVASTLLRVRTPGLLFPGGPSHVQLTLSCS
jgi:signal transduction histidine kinase